MVQVSDAILPEILKGTETIENIMYVLSLLFIKSQEEKNKKLPEGEQINIFSMSIETKEGESTVTIDFKDIPLDTTVLRSVITPINILQIPGYTPAPTETTIAPFGSGGGAINTFIVLTYYLAKLQVMPEVNLEGEDIISYEVKQSKSMAEPPMLMSGSLVLPLKKIYIENKLTYQAIEVFTGPSPWVTSS